MAPATYGDAAGYAQSNNRPGIESRNAQFRTVHNVFLVNLGQVNANTGTGAAAFFAGHFQLDQCQKYSDFVDLFDQYRIRLVELFGTTGNIPQNPSTTDSTSELLVAIDFDDDTVPTAVTDLYNYETVQVVSPGQHFSRRFRPQVIATVLDNAAAPADAVSSGLWIDLNSPDVPYYGWKVACTASGTTSVTRWNLWARLHVEFRGRH